MTTPNCSGTSSGRALPSEVRIGSHVLRATTASRSVAVGGGGPSPPHDAVARSLCVVGEMVDSNDENNSNADGLPGSGETVQLQWYLSSLENYNRKKIRVDESVAIASATIAAAGCGGSAPIYIRLPMSLTFRQYALLASPSLTCTASLESTSSAALSGSSEDALTSAGSSARDESPQCMHVDRCHCPRPPLRLQHRPNNCGVGPSTGSPCGDRSHDAVAVKKATAKPLLSKPVRPSLRRKSQQLSANSSNSGPVVVRADM